MAKQNQTEKVKKKVKNEVKKEIKKNKKLQLAILIIVLIIVLAVVLTFVIKPEFFHAMIAMFKGNKNDDKDIKGITPIEGAKLEMQVLNIGQGDSILFTFPDGITMLMDIGSEFRTPSCWGVVDQALKDEQISTIDYVFISHADYDHIRELKKLCVNYEIKNFYIPKLGAVMSNTWNDALPVVQAETYGTDNTPAKINYNLGEYVISGDGWKMDCYSFTGEENFYKNMSNSSSAENKNAISPICILEYGGRKICLTGDANEITEEYVLSQGYLDEHDVDVLKIGHHGSKSSTTQDFLNKIDPEFAIISTNGTSYGHPHEELMTRLQNYTDLVGDSDYDGFASENGYRIYRTDKDGTCTVQIGANGTMNVISEKLEDNNRTIVSVSLTVFAQEHIFIVNVNKYTFVRDMHTTSSL